MKTVYEIANGTIYEWQAPDSRVIVRPFTEVPKPSEDNQVIIGFDWLKNEWQTEEKIPQGVLDELQDILGNADLTDNQLNNLGDLFPVWKVGETYKKGSVVRFDEKLYEYFGEEESVATEQLAPNLANYLWREVKVTSEGGEAVLEWVMPTGYENAYKKGDIVLYTPTGKKYKSLIDGNSQEPTKDEPYNRYWKELEE